jgi:hypothetical protein
MSETKILCNYNITDHTFTNIFRCVILLKSRACMTDLILLNISVILCRPDLLIEEPRERIQILQIDNITLYILSQTGITYSIWFTNKVTCVKRKNNVFSNNKEIISPFWCLICSHRYHSNISVLCIKTLK